MARPSLYAQYIKEREGLNVVETEHGFASYELDKDFAYIVDIYVLPQHRKSGLASELADKVQEIAKRHNVRILLGSIDPKASGADVSEKALLGYGFKKSHETDALVFYKKEIL